MSLQCPSESTRPSLDVQMKVLKGWVRGSYEADELPPELRRKTFATGLAFMVLLQRSTARFTNYSILHSPPEPDLVQYKPYTVQI